MSSIVYSVIECSKLIEELVAMLESCIEREKEFQALSSEYITQFQQVDRFNRWIHSPNCGVRQELCQHRGELYDKREEKQDEECATDHSTSLPVTPLVAAKLDDAHALEASMLFTELTGVFHFAAKVIGDNHLGYIPGTYWIYRSDSCKSLHPFMEIVDVE